MGPGTWDDMRPQDFDASVPLTLFDFQGGATTPRKPDACGTPDLFSAPEESPDGF